MVWKEIMKPKIIAILCADIHLSHKPPIWRSNEPDWYAAMLRPLDEIQELQVKYKCPVLGAGDIFDKWNSPAELINWAMIHLPKEMYSVPGQHDLPEHDYKQLYRSAYMSLARGRCIRDMFGVIHQPLTIFNMNAVPFGWKMESVCKELKKVQWVKNIALVHDYVCTTKSDYPGAPKEAYIGKVSNDKLINGKLYGYDVIVYGDNHKGFTAHVGKTTIFNCGTLMRRKSDELDYKPQVGLLYSDGDVATHYLDISKDVHLTVDDTVKEAEALDEIDMEVFAKELRKLGSSALDFANAIKQFWTREKTKQKVQDIILKAMGE